MFRVADLHPAFRNLNEAETVFRGLDDDGMAPGKDGMPGARLLADRRHATIVSVRHELRDLLAKFGE